jgi:shikimate kinase/3-dehydroquinate synthase
MLGEWNFVVPSPDSTVRVSVGHLSECRLAPVERTAIITEPGAWAVGRDCVLEWARSSSATVEDPLVLPAGDAAKELDRLGGYYAHLAACRLDRSSRILVVGGGAALDVGAFLAATFLRGLRFVLVPSTLLSQVDAALGGKCGINFLGAKNQIGLVVQPELIAVDPDWLQSEPRAARDSGLGEVWKTAWLAGGELWARCQTAGRLTDRVELAWTIDACLRFKAEVVSQDPLEQGRRAILNLGHTIGHALEGAAQAGGIALPHGVAVALGLLAELKPTADEVEWKKLATLVRASGLPTEPPSGIDYGVARNLLSRDKKRAGGMIVTAIVPAPGQVRLESRPVDYFADLLRLFSRSS